MNKTTLTGVLTSRIETRQDYYYGFFTFPDQNQDIPVIFKTKPILEKGSQVELTGQWANSNKERPSFTCHQYQLLKEPSPPSLQSLQKQLSSLLKPSLDQKKNWTETTDFLFRKKKELEEMEKVSTLGNHYLHAYLLTKQAFYANYQTEHLEQANFSLPSYLHRVSSELEITKRQMIASGWKEVKNG